MSASPPILLQKSFCTGGRKFCGPPTRFSCKDVGAPSPHVKLTGDLANVSEAIRIGDCFPFRNFAKNQSPCNFRLLQQYRGRSGHRARASAASLLTRSGHEAQYQMTSSPRQKNCASLCQCAAVELRPVGVPIDSGVNHAAPRKRTRPTRLARVLITLSVVLRRPFAVLHNAVLGR
jgi:hypothetical protein